MLNKFLKDEREAVRRAAEEIEEWFYPKYAEPEWYEAEGVGTPDDDYDESWNFLDEALQEEELDTSDDFNEDYFNADYEIDIPF